MDYGGCNILDPLTKQITRKALIEILVQVVKKEDDTCKGVELIELLFVSDPSPETAKEILNILKPDWEAETDVST